MRRWLCLVALSWALGPLAFGQTGLAVGQTGLALEHNCPAECPACEEEQLQCEKTVLDECQCCPVCVRSLNEDCGSTAGVCEAHLTCTQLNDNDEFGKCTDMYPSKCLSANCSVVFHPKCPSDSRLVILPPPVGQCCGTPGTCHCDQQKCESVVPTCEIGTERVMVEEGRAEPGKCCDLFECRKRESHCASVSCPPLPLDEDAGVDCPADSVRPAEHVPIGGCCPIRPGCRCRAAECRPAVCPEGKKIKIIRKGNGNPGRCCDEWQCDEDPTPVGKSCERDGKIYADGTSWSYACETCKCKKGVAVCSKMMCSKTPADCTWVMIPEGECCPVCVGCQTDKFEKKKKLERWQKDDCTTCSCSEEGTAVCEKYMCQVNCENPRKVEGQCCPVCDEPSVFTLPEMCPDIQHCPLRCENGLQRDNRGCFECQCLPVEHPKVTECPQLSKDNCEKQCAHGYMKDASGCVVCKCAKCPPLQQCFKHCLYGFETNSVGCPVCKCRAMSRIDATLTIPEKIGKIAGWDKCHSIGAKGKFIERDGGEWWTDGCRHCFCEQKKEFCSLISCPPRPPDCEEENWVKKEGGCCPSCTSSTSSLSVDVQHEHTVCHSPGTGLLFTDGETWQLAPCVSCTCRVGQVLCRTMDCPPTPCEHPELHSDDQCCPRCPSSDNTTVISETTVVCTDGFGTAHVSGSSWRTDDCTSCTCTSDSRVVCFRETCDDVTMCSGSPLIIKGKCCPVCSDALSASVVCRYNSTVYAVNEEWKAGPCSKCSCTEKGQVVCKETMCPPCKQAVPLEGHCCPLCKDVGHFSLGEDGVAVPPIPPSRLTLIGVSLMGLSILGLLVLLFILYKRSRSMHTPLHVKDPSVRLSASKSIGSTPHLDEWMTEKRRDSTCDGQSESLLSTVSETSTSISSASSGTGPQPDTRPLTNTRNSSRSKLFQCHV